MNTEDQNYDQNKKDSASQQHGNSNSAFHHRNAHKNNWILATAIFLLIILVIFLFSIQHNYNSRISELQRVRLELNTTILTKDSIINNYMGDFNDIENTIDSIKNKEHIISGLSNGSEEQVFSGDKKKQIIEDIKYMNYLLDKDKKQIAKLYTELSNSGMRLMQFEQRLKILDKKIEERDSSIADLKKQLVNKNFELAQLNEKIDMQSSIIENSQIELNRAFYAIGTYKELKKKGVIVQNGGFLWFGGNISIVNNSTDSSFQTIDIRHTVMIPIESKTAKFISNHPKDSYQWIKKENKISYVQIIDPGNFWKYTHYAVLETN